MKTKASAATLRKAQATLNLLADDGKLIGERAVREVLADMAVGLQGTIEAATAKEDEEAKAAEKAAEAEAKKKKKG